MKTLRLAWITLTTLVLISCNQMKYHITTPSRESLDFELITADKASESLQKHAHSLIKEHGDIKNRKAYLLESGEVIHTFFGNGESFFFKSLEDFEALFSEGVRMFIFTRTKTGYLYYFEMKRAFAPKESEIKAVDISTTSAKSYYQEDGGGYLEYDSTTRFWTWFPNRENLDSYIQIIIFNQ